MNRAVIYCRISSDPTGKAAGVKRQEADCRKLADRLGLEVVQAFTDNDISASSGKKRPAWEAMLNLVEADGIDTLICWHTDRLYRRPVDLERLLDLLDAGALPGMVRTVTAGDLDLSTASGRMVARLLVAVSIHEVEHARERIISEKRQRAEAGLPGGGRRPFGYADDKITVLEDEAALIREAVARITDGESLREITDDWTARGVETRDRGPWRTTTIRNIVTNPRIAGWRTYKGEIVGPAAWHAIVSDDDWKLMVATLRDPSRRRRGGRPDGRTFWLSGLLVCGRCGTRLWSSSRPSEPSLTHYRCPPKPYGDGCGRLGVNADKTEAHISMLMFDRLTNTSLGDLNPAPSGSRRAELQAALDDNLQRLIDIGEAIGTGVMTVAVGASAERAALAEKKRLETELRRLTLANTTVAVPASLDIEDWKQTTPEDLKEIAGVLLRRVVVHPAEYSGQQFTPGRVSVEWADGLGAEGEEAA